MNHWRAFLATSATVAVGIYTSNSWLAFTAGAITAAAVWWNRIRDLVEGIHDHGRWWAETNLTDALVIAGVLSTSKPNQPRPVLHRLGQPTHDTHGTTVKVKLPPGVDYTSVAIRQTKIAAALDLPASRLHITKKPTDPESVARFRVDANIVETKHRRSPLANAQSTVWTDPAELGTDRGQVVKVGTFQENTMIAGRMGSGKSVCGRPIIGQFALDPRALIYGLDGKGSRKDYGLVAKIATRWVWGGTETAPTDTLAMLKELLELVRQRNAADTDDSAPADGVLLILEEFQDIRQSATKSVCADIDGVLGQVLRMGRAIGFHVLILTQRPSVEDFPSGMRNLITNRISLDLPVPADYKLVLGHTPRLTLPDAPGKAIVSTASGDRAIVVDYLNNTDWKALCQRAAELRRPTTAPEPTTTPQPTSPPTDPLLLAVLAVLTEHPAGLSATDILSLIPTGHMTNTTTLGKALGRFEREGWVERDKDAVRGRFWRLNESGRRESASFEAS